MRIFLTHLAMLSLLFASSPSFAEADHTAIDTQPPAAGAMDESAQATPEKGGYYQIKCGSSNYKTTECGVRGRIIGAYMVRQESQAACIANRTWGVSQNYIWVSNGCRAIFAVRIR